MNGRTAAPKPYGPKGKNNGNSLLDSKYGSPVFIDPSSDGSFYASILLITTSVTSAAMTMAMAGRRVLVFASSTTTPFLNSNQNANLLCFLASPLSRSASPGHFSLISSCSSSGGELSSLTFIDSVVFI